MAECIADSSLNSYILQVYGALGGTTITVGLGDILFRGVHVTGFWCAHLRLANGPAVCPT